MLIPKNSHLDCLYWTWNKPFTICLPCDSISHNTLNYNEDIVNNITLLLFPRKTLPMYYLYHRILNFLKHLFIIFICTGGIFSQVTETIITTGNNNSTFGRTVFSLGDIVIVGAEIEDHYQINSESFWLMGGNFPYTFQAPGRAYIFNRNQNDEGNLGGN